MKSIIIFFLFIVTYTNGIAQFEKRPSNSFFVEIGGSGGLGSINYERGWLSNGVLALKWRLGLSAVPIDKNNGVGVVFPVMLEGIYGKGAHQLELGLGQGITVTTRGSAFALTTAVIGYRYHRVESPWFFRVAYTPLISYLIDFQVQQWGGLSIGYSLKNK